MIRFLIVDALNLIRRVHAAAPSPSPAEPAKDALLATVSSLRRALRETRPTHAVAVFDGTERTWRHERFADYKAGRAPMPEDLRSDLGRYREAFAAEGVSSTEKPDLEADDVIATLATKVAASGGSAVILSTDTIFCQLASSRIAVRDHFRKRELDRDYVLDKLSVSPEQLVDLWGLAGSPTTNIPGVPGVGVKTAARLLAEHGALDAVLDAARGMPGRLGEALRDHAERARMSRELARLRTDLELGWNLKAFSRPAEA